MSNIGDRYKEAREVVEWKEEEEGIGDNREC
jgi:hypothetical protein